MTDPTYAAPPSPTASASEKPQYHPLAITAFVFSILAYNLLPLVGAIAAIIIGKHARTEIDEGSLGGRGLATAAVRLGWFALVLWVLAMLAIVALVIVLIARGG